VSQTNSRVIHKAMAKQPWNRFGSAREFGETIQKTLRNESIEVFDSARIQPRLQRANNALNSGDYQFASEMAAELEAEGIIGPQLTLLRTQIDMALKQRDIRQVLETARAYTDQHEIPLALDKINQMLMVYPDSEDLLAMRATVEMFLKHGGRRANWSEEIEKSEPKTKQWDVFISHASADRDFTERLAKELQGPGLKTWLDATHVKGGEDWAQQIREGIENSRLCIVVLSRTSAVSKPWISREWASIQECSWQRPEMPICSLRIDDVDPIPKSG
jgi:hypothetical protein